MPPPKPSTEGRRDRQAFNEMGQIVRALEAGGPATHEDLEIRVGRAYWEPHRFDRALRFGVTDGLISRTEDGMLHPL